MNKAGVLLNVFMLVAGFSCSAQEETGSRYFRKDTRGLKEGVNPDSAGDKSKEETQKKEYHPVENKSVIRIDPAMRKYIEELRNMPKDESESSSTEIGDKKPRDIK